MQLENTTNVSTGAAGAQPSAPYASLRARPHERPPARAAWPAKAPRPAPIFRPVYVEHKKKVPLSTFELKVDDLSPLQRRALDKLPTAMGVPVIRAIDKRDALGFVFRFSVAPAELTAQALPNLLERWDEKYEVAKAKAGLTPKPEPQAQPLKPRSPRRAKAEDPAEEGGDPGPQVKVDMSVVDAAIAAHDAEGYADAVRAGARQCDQDGQDELADPVGSSLGGDGQAALQELAAREEEPAQAQPADAADRGDRPPGDAFDALPEDYVLSVPFAAAPTAQPADTTADRPPAKPRGGGRRAAQGAAVEETAAPGNAATTGSAGAGHEPRQGEAAPGGPAEQVVSLPAVRLATGAAEEAARHWIDPATGEAWPALCRLHLVAADEGSVTTWLDLLPLPRVTKALCERAAAAQTSAAAWLADAAAQLNQALLERMKGARMPVAERSAHLVRALQQLPLWLDRLQDLLVDMQRARDLARRIDQQLLAMPEWAIVVRNTLGEQPDWHRAYLDSASSNDAVALLGRYCGPLAGLRLTRQIGLFADPAAMNLQRQLAHIVAHARCWSEPENARGDCARVLAVWIDAVHQHVPEHVSDPEKTAETGIFPA